MFVLQCTTMLQRIILCFDVLNIIGSTVWGNEFIATMNVVKDNSGDIASGTYYHIWVSFGR